MRRPDPGQELFSRSVEQLELSEETLQLLRDNGITTFGELRALAEQGQLDSLHGLDRKHLIEVLGRIKQLTRTSMCAIYFGD